MSIEYAESPDCTKPENQTHRPNPVGAVCNRALIALSLRIEHLMTFFVFSLTKRGEL